MTKARRPSQGRTSKAEEHVERIREAFKTLNLRHAAASFEGLLADPPEVSRLEWLWSILEPQARKRVESRVERRIRESRLPERKTLEAFDFAFQPDLDRDLVFELTTLAFVREGKNLLLAGHSGTGKSHIAMALALNACASNLRVRYTTSADMLKNLNASLADETLEQELKRYTRPDLLVIDEVGLEQVEQEVASRAGLMQKVLIPRYKPQRSTIITSNIPWEAWGDYLEDHLGATALLDRLIHHSHVIVIQGPSWRDHEHNLDVQQARARTETISQADTKPSADKASLEKKTSTSSKKKRSTSKRSTSKKRAGTAAKKTTSKRPASKKRAGVAAKKKRSGTKRSTPQRKR